MTNKPAILVLDTRSFSSFVDELKSVVTRPKDAERYMDGLAGKRCLELVPYETVRTLGAFFTPTVFANSLIDQLDIEDWNTVTTFDPACGAGDLLLPVARRLKLKRTVSETLNSWVKRISGCDLSPEFVNAARLRLVLLAQQRGALLDDSPYELSRLLTSIVVEDGLETRGFQRADVVVMNPPYSRMVIDEAWKSGTGTKAALFVARAAQLCPENAQIAALLPEVLRSGSSYENWRRYIRQLAGAQPPISLGLFSNKADVDVFLQRFTKLGHGPQRPPKEAQADVETVSSKFTIAVGTVVPHRHHLRGPKLAFLHPRNAKPWTELLRINEKRRFDGRAFKPPFVVVRRTSRPGDRYRATATLIRGKSSVAVENHLIVLQPKRGAEGICRMLLKLLRTDQASEHFNRVIRCRHLTVASVASLPWKLGV
jgi:hypothetical protein